MEPRTAPDLDPAAAPSLPALAFDNSFARDLAGHYVDWQPAKVPAPALLFVNRPLAEELGIAADTWSEPQLAAVLSGNQVPAGAQPIAQVYAGHQFGGFSPQLGDGRALLLGELIDRTGRRRDLAFKGSGRTPFARGGDGKAAVGPMLREVLIGEAMHALGIPTTRALAVVATGEPVFREQALPGAVLTRVAASHLRVGSFEYFAARRDHERLRRLADYAIARHDPDLARRDDRYLELLRAVARRQAHLIALWMNVGFIHGVMNTDNMTISGETIDYGPCAFLDAYDPATVFSSIDSQGRYAYCNQPAIAQWNLARLAEALLPLIADDADAAVSAATEVLAAFPGWYEAEWLAGQRAKLGLRTGRTGDAALAQDFLAVLETARADFTLAYRRLADAAAGDDAPILALVDDPAPLSDWLARWRSRCAAEDRDAATAGERAQQLRAVNPWIVPRNHRVEAALAAASERGDLAPFNALLAGLRRPFDEDPQHAEEAVPAGAEFNDRFRTFCGT
jgi:serine/tyrosine/threonine adenylyltransferase